ncbi:MAG: hypothetical protein ACK4JC_08020 [Silanimonas lenta]
MATNRTRTSPARRRAPEAVTPRTLFLAGLGAAIVTRREAGRLAAQAVALPQRLKAGAEAAVATAQKEACKLRREAEGRLAPVRRELAAIGDRAGRIAGQGIDALGQRLNPLLARAGLPTFARPAKPKAPRKAAKTGRARRPAAKKAAPARRRAA